MGIEVEDRVARQLFVAADERGRQLQRRQRLPDRLVQGERVRMVDERLEQQLQRLLRAVRGREVPGEGEARAPVLRVRRNQLVAERRIAIRRAERRVGALEPREGEVGALG